MSSSLFRRLVAAAIALVVVTLATSSLSCTALEVLGAPLDSAIRARALEITLGAALLAAVVALLVSRTLTARVRRLKRCGRGITRRRSATRNPHRSRRRSPDLLERSLVGVGQELRGLVSNLRFESARREAILAGMAEGVLAVDPDLRVTFCNQALLAATKVPRRTLPEGVGLLPGRPRPGALRIDSYCARLG